MIAEGSFDQVTIDHVLEQAESPTATLRAIHRVLRPDGLLFVEVPNMLDPNMFYDLLLHEHLFHFTPDTLGALLERHGFTTVAVEPSTPYGAQRFIARKVRPVSSTAPAADPAGLARLRDGGASWRRMWAQLQESASTLAAEAGAGRRVALFGAGMTTAILLTYTGLGDARIVALIDESPWKVGRTYFGLPIHGLADLGTLKIDVIGIATIPGSQPLVRRKLAATLSTRSGGRAAVGVPDIVCLVEG
jgi:hypothetical protein